MKKLFTLLVIVAFTLSVDAQPPNKMSYQSVLRDNSGALVTNQAVGMKISILQGSATGNVVFSETYSPNPQTNANGLITVEIGGGTAAVGSFSAINWSSGTYYLRTETDPSGGTNYSIVGTSQLLSVPYAMHAKTVETLAAESDPLFSASPASGITVGNTTNWNTAYGWGNHSGLYRPASWVPSWADVTGKPAFATVATSGSFADLLSKPTTLAGYGITDADNSNTNEIQTLSLSGTQLSLSLGGGTVTLPSSGGGDNWGTQTVATDVTLTGLGIETNPLRINDGGVTSAKILDGSILSNDIANFMITSEKLANNSVTTEKISERAVTGIKIAQGGATTGQVLKWNSTSWAPADDETGEGGLILPYSGTGTSDSPLFNIVNLGTSGAISTLSNGNYGIWGESANSTGIGVYGVNKNTTGATYGVMGDVYSPTGYSGYFQGGRFYIQGNTGIGTNNPTALLHTQGMDTGQGNVVFEGQFKSSNPGMPPVSGAGTRLMWYPDKAAFRAGHALGNEWDAASIGFGSIAMGYNTTAAGDFSTSMGNNSNATADFSTALGFETTASNLFATAFGNNCNATGLISTAMGFNTMASGETSFALGNYASATGATSVAMGYNTIAPSAFETVIGICNTNYTPSSSAYWDANDRLFVIGNGTSSSSRSNAVTVLKNGRVGLGTHVPNRLLHVYGIANPRILVESPEQAPELNLQRGSTTHALYVNGNFDLVFYCAGDKMALTDDGNVGIGTSAPNYKLDVRGTIGNNTTLYHSDKRWKTNIVPLKYGIDELKKLNSVSYLWNDNDYPEMGFDGEIQFGFIAQDFEKVIPELVRTDEDGYKSIDYVKMTPILVEAIKEQQKQIDELKEIISNLITSK